jgi:hypothetical protein
MFKDVQFPSPKAAANESKYPNIVELAVGGNELDVTLGRQVINFHKSRHIQPHHGRTIIRQHHIFYRWCFSDMATAHEFMEKFGGEFARPVSDDVEGAQDCGEHCEAAALSAQA